jgi:hypothetical protein
MLLRRCKEEATVANTVIPGKEGANQNGRRKVNNFLCIFPREKWNL